MQFRSRKSFGPRISLTETQIAKVTATVEAAGLLCEVENCRTGSAYVTIFEKTSDTDINGHPIEVTGDEIAKIRLSGHDEGRRTDSTYNVVGSKAACLASLNRWIADVIANR